MINKMVGHNTQDSPLLAEVEQSRLAVSRAVDSKKKAQFGQFFTPASIAKFMAELFFQDSGEICYLLDAGAGIGSLSAAFLDRWADDGFHFRHVELDVFEIDESLLPYLTRTLEKYKTHLAVAPTVRATDFIHASTEWISGNLFAEQLPQYTHAILNPPYKKIRSDSAYRAALRRAGIETVNLYSAFVALALSLLADHGQLVAIIPRSFCNGPYYRPFREFLLTHSAIHHIHLFESRNKAFKDDGVLQENIIILLERGGEQGPVTISTSTDDSFTDLTIQEHPFERIVFPDDPEQFIHVPTSAAISTLELHPAIHWSLSDIGINVSTGPVVAFRMKEYLRRMPEAGTVPLLHPGNFNQNGTEWPNMKLKKPNAIQRNSSTKKWLFPNGYYCVVRRFSSKEEKRRIVAAVADPFAFPDAPMLGFENHLNVFHDNKHGLSKALAYGLAMFLNSTAVDEYFRRFSGHTQVNATDLKQMKYPDCDTLIEFGEWVLEQKELTQTMIDDKLGTLIDG